MMTFYQQSNLLPDTIWENLEIGLRDYLAVKKDPKYVFDDDYYHKHFGKGSGAKTHVDIMGCVMAKTFKFPYKKHCRDTSDFFSYELDVKLWTIHHAARKRLDRAYEKLWSINNRDALDWEYIHQVQSDLYAIDEWIPDGPDVPKALANDGKAYLEKAVAILKAENL